MRKLGLALGGGGARGLAHLAVLEVLDRLAWKPSMIAGSSIGAILGCFYASGKSATEIEDVIRGQISRDWREMLPGRPGGRWLELVRLQRGRGGVLSAEHFMETLTESIEAEHFDDLEIPLKVVAADFWNRRQVVLGSGEVDLQAADLVQALQASMALPAIFRPVQIGDQVLIDGGVVNPVPFDLLQDSCDVILAVNVVGKRTQREGGFPGITAAVFNTFQIMQLAIVQEKRTVAREQLRRAGRPPLVYLEPPLRDVRMLEFHRVDEILAQARTHLDGADGRESLEARLERLRSGPLA